MVFGHQINVQNKITYLNFEARKAIYEAASGTGSADDVTRRIAAAGEPLVEAMLFVGETELTEPVTGTSGYADHFAALGPVDGRGRSLRQFDLTQRLFRYPLSYVIYTEHFDTLPDPAADYVYGRLAEILTGRDRGEVFSNLSADDRLEIFEILQETKPEFLAFAD